MTARKPLVDLVDVLAVLGACDPALDAVRAWSRRQRPEHRTASRLFAYACRRAGLDQDWSRWLAWVTGPGDPSKHSFGATRDEVIKSALTELSLRAGWCDGSCGSRLCCERHEAADRLTAALRAHGIEVPS